MSDQQKWFVIYTKPRWEKKVHARLLQRGFESYCPINKQRRKWSDRVKLIEEPLFKSYVFIHVEEESLTKVRMVDGVLNFVYWNGKPGVVKDSEITSIKRFLNEYEGVTVVPADIRPDSKVLIHQGVFMDQEARVQKVLNNKVEVVIESLGYKLVAHVDKSNIIHFPE